MTIHIGLLLFPAITQLDLTAPWEAFRHVPDAQVHLLWKETGPVMAEGGMRIEADTKLSEAPRLDVICIPGGRGIDALLEDQEVLTWLVKQAETARFICSVCTGALVLGAAGLLRGKKATTYWAAHDFLTAFGAEPVQARVVQDGKLLTGGGVTAGLDLALSVIAAMSGEALAQSVQLQMEYAPAPPFQSGRPEQAPPAIRAEVEEMLTKGRAARRQIIDRITAQKLTE
ncbi:Transcriptional regulator, AraC family [Granulibacter bethesdensis]|uniref:Transcriptional regulator, AraC family n=1 Tax=Granulibacter bethesdensis TaxID=364410 RepID=A0AAN0RF20_9PROT|nr:DJ-1/PfpI family protein [Granulibacter bethesdensis]AHJ63733.1 Transcriptional regulator, AraC family [Granulibacter bethesdensis]APH57671.1 Transcriptional regulator, AraC family [Granulibacter bethesdensis]